MEKVPRIPQLAAMIVEIARIRRADIERNLNMGCLSIRRDAERRSVIQKH
jgi:hypothetical protein